MRARGEEEERVAHFLMQCLFCMFAEDEGLLPGRIFSRMLDAAVNNTERAAERVRQLFAAMSEPDGFYGSDDIAWFNGGLFCRVEIPALQKEDLEALKRAAAKDWRAINPTIFGTLFERGLNPGSRAQLGAHYTDVATIEKLVHPLLFLPLDDEWAKAREGIKAIVAKASKKALREASALYHAFLLRLENFRVLDPACGSGNFLYLSLRALREVEKRVRVEAAELGLQAGLAMHTGPHNVLGLEINEYAAELARVTVWIGDIQWSRQNGYPHAINPILRPLEGIARRDALLNEDGSEAEWPKADVIVGNPPFLGGSKKRRELGGEYFDRLNAAFAEHVPGGADLVCYWFYKARQHIEAGLSEAAGLVATNSIRGGANRTVLDAIVGTNTAVGARHAVPLRIFEAWSDEAWVNDGAAVRVSMVCFGKCDGVGARHAVPLLNGQPVDAIHADLTAVSGLDLSIATPLAENVGCSIRGTQKIGAFDIPGELARQWLKLPNPNGKRNSDVVKPWSNGMDIMRRSSDTWIIDFGVDMSEAEAALYEKPFEHVVEHVKPVRMANNREMYRRYWWRHGEPQPALRTTLAGLSRYIVTPRVAKHRMFGWLSGAVLPDSAVVAFACSDDTTFGILSSRFHELWSLRLGTSLEDRPRYTPSTCFETFPFPEGLTLKDRAENTAIAEAAKRLHELRENWLNPAEWVEWAITPEEEKAGFPMRPVAKPGHEADLKERTLTKLYNQRPAWLDNANQALDAAVASAYGWTDYTPDMPDEEILRRLLALNLARSALH
jgi:type II restriction/modification system DNA methylase subunit YeeA